MSDLTLNQTLKARGYTTVPAGGLALYRKHILLDGMIVFTGDASDVWGWLKEVTDV